MYIIVSQVMLKRSYNERCGILRLRSLYAHFLESVTIWICPICMVSSISPQSLHFSSTHTEHPLSHICASQSHSSYPWKKMKWIHSLQYMCWTLSPWNDFWAFDVVLHITVATVMFTVSWASIPMQHCPKLILFMLFILFKQLILI